MSQQPGGGEPIAPRTQKMLKMIRENKILTEEYKDKIEDWKYGLILNCGGSGVNPQFGSINKKPGTTHGTIFGIGGCEFVEI